MVLNYQYKPVKFYLLIFMISYAVLAAAIYFSYNESTSLLKLVFIFADVLVPSTVAICMIYGSGNDALKKDFLNRLANLKLIKPKTLWMLLVVPVGLLLATAISLLFGKPAEQFQLSPGFSFAQGQIFTTLIIIILAPLFEEIGWRGYGVDSLYKAGRTLFVSTMLFAVLWAAWHIPLVFINGYYHNEVLKAGPVYAANFFISIFPAAFLMNWLFYKNGRSIIVTFLFHCAVNLFSSLFQTEQFTKCIFTIILIVVSVVVFIVDKRFWLKRTDKDGAGTA
jgi:membrane protease YdiL (CAAX protease family)